MLRRTVISLSCSGATGVLLCFWHPVKILLFYWVLCPAVRYGMDQGSQPRGQVLTLVDHEWHPRDSATAWLQQLKSAFGSYLISPSFTLILWLKTSKTRQFIWSIWVKLSILPFSIKISSEKSLSISQTSKDSRAAVRRCDWQPPPHKQQKNAQCSGRQDPIAIPKPGAGRAVDSEVLALHSFSTILFLSTVARFIWIVIITIWSRL